MKIPTLAMILALIAASSCAPNEQPPAAAAKPVAAAASPESIEQELKTLSDGWAKANVAKDVSYLDKIWASDFSYTEPSGRVFNKEQGMSDLAKDTNTIISEEVSNFKVLTYGTDFAVTRGDDTTVSQDKNGKTIRTVGRFTNIWVKRNGAWQCVVGHFSEIK